MRVSVCVHRYQAHADTIGYHLGISFLLARQTPLPAELPCLPKYIQKRQLKQVSTAKGRQQWVNYCVKRFPEILLVSPALWIVFPTTPFPGKSFLLERQGEAEAARHSPTQVNVWVLCTKQEKLDAIAFHKDEAVETSGEPVGYGMYSFVS